MSYQRRAIERYLAERPGEAALAAVVAGRPVQDSLAQYEKADAIALEYQSRYKRLGWWALAMTTLGTLLGAIELCPLDAWLSGPPSAVMGGLQAIALVLATLMTYAIGRFGWVGTWMSSRAEAEDLRGHVFEAILQAEGPPDSDARLLWRHKLDLVMAAYVKDQLAFFRKSAERHARGASRVSRPRLLSYTVTLAAIVIGAAAFALILYGFGAPLPNWLMTAARYLAVENSNRWQLGLGTIASSLLAYANARSLMEQDERNASLYKMTAAELDKLMGSELERAAQAAAEGDGKSVVGFFRKAQDILAADHLVWYIVGTARPEHESPLRISRIS